MLPCWAAPDTAAFVVTPALNSSHQNGESNAETKRICEMGIKQSAPCACFHGIATFSYHLGKTLKLDMG
jgi:hypothetical protein